MGKLHLKVFASMHCKRHHGRLEFVAVDVGTMERASSQVLSSNEETIFTNNTGLGCICLLLAGVTISVRKPPTLCATLSGEPSPNASRATRNLLP
jgi:hypothetical protein